jgi:ribosome biogenesis GTPase
VELDDAHSIVAARPRDNFLARFNQKGQKPQVLAANIGLVLCLASPASPPFRPRFLDRVLVQAEASGIEAVIVLNKCDLWGGRTFQNGDGAPRQSVPRPPPRKPRDAGLPLPPQKVKTRLADYERIGYRILRISAQTGEGLPELEKLIAGKTSVLLGQSGVGKSTLLNALNPSLQLKTGAVNEKWDRGNHTTTQPVLYELPPNDDGESAAAKIIDTPGIRRMVPWGVSAADLPLYLKEFAPYAGKCAFGLSCTHLSEPGCAILAAVESGAISGERYESFLRMRAEL